MDAATSRRLLEFSRSKKIPKFHSFRRMVDVEKMREDGTIFKTRVALEPWSFPVATQYIRSRGIALAATAVREGWHVHLINYVAYQQSMPDSEGIRLIKENAERVEMGLKTAKSSDLATIKANRERLANELTAARAAAE